jgi:hypothetical protein
MLIFEKTSLCSAQAAILPVALHFLFQGDDSILEGLDGLGYQLPGMGNT